MSQIYDKDNNVIFLYAEGKDITELKKSRDELEKKINERTVELICSNKLLEEEIGERRILENLLMKSEERYRGIVEDQTEIICRWTSGRKIAFANNAFWRFFDIIPDESGGTTFFPQVIEVDREFIEKNISQITIQNTINKFEHRIILNNNEVKWLQWTNRGIFDGKGKLIEYQSVGRDITEKKIIENALNENRELLNTLIENAPVLIFLKDRGYRYFMVNKKFEFTFGYKRGEILGKTDYEIFDTENVTKMRENDLKVFIDLVPVQYEQEIVLGDKKMYFAATKFPLLKTNNEAYGICGINLDITERKKTESELVKSKEFSERINRMKNEFLGYLSHELRNPLGVITLYTHSIRSKQELKNDTENKLALIDKAVGSAVKIIDEVIDISKIEAGEMIINYSNFNIKKLIDEIIDEIKLIITGDIKFNINIEFERMYSDHQRVKQVLSNLISNSLKYTEQGSITINAGIKKDKYIFSVTDTGIGIKEENLDKVFEPFFREVVDKYPKKGMGLALSICKKIISNLGGEINVKSKKGKGSSFIFSLPFENTEESIN